VFSGRPGLGLRSTQRNQRYRGTAVPRCPPGKGRIECLVPLNHMRLAVDVDDGPSQRRGVRFAPPGQAVTILCNSSWPIGRYVLIPCGEHRSGSRSGCSFLTGRNYSRPVFLSVDYAIARVGSAGGSSPR
jgi:hypothetical protein